MSEYRDDATPHGAPSQGAGGDAAGESPVPLPDVRYEWYSHDQLKALVDTGNDPESAGEIGESWRSLGRTLQQASEQLGASSATSEEAWQGEAGRALRAALDRATAWAGRAAATADALGGAVAAQAGASAHARSAMPDPVSYDPGGMIRDAMGAGDLAALAGLTDAMAERRAEAEEARRRAVDVLHARDLALRDAAGVRSFTVPPRLAGPA